MISSCIVLLQRLRLRHYYGRFLETHCRRQLASSFICEQTGQIALSTSRSLFSATWTMASKKPYSSDADAASSSLTSLYSPTPTTHANKRSSYRTKGRTPEWFLENCMPTTYTSLFSLSLPAWIIALISLRLCGYLAMLDLRLLVPKRMLLASWAMFFVWKNSGFYFSAYYRRNPVRLPQLRAVSNFPSNVYALFLATATFFVVSAGPSHLLPSRVVLVLGDSVISGLLAWLIARADSAKASAGMAISSAIQVTKRRLLERR